MAPELGRQVEETAWALLEWVSDVLDGIITREATFASSVTLHFFSISLVRVPISGIRVVAIVSLQMCWNGQTESRAKVLSASERQNRQNKATCRTELRLLSIHLVCPSARAFTK